MTILARIAIMIAAYGLGLLSGYLLVTRSTKPESIIDAQQSKVLDTVGKESLPCNTVEAYKPVAKKKLSLPPAIKDDPAKVVTSSTDVQPDLNQHRIVSVFDVDTGKTVAYNQTMPLPWLAVDRRGEAGLSYGYRRSEAVIRLEARQSLLDIKAVRVGVVASVDKPIGGRADAYIGIGAWYRW